MTIGGLHYRDIPNPGRHVGVLLDASAQHAGRTGREVLELGARTMGLPAPASTRCSIWCRSTRAESKRRVRNYSLGMRQRLGIAHALLGDPTVLILDEPANGLDPAGIRWMRGLLKGYADQGGTVLLSSHLLHEVEQIADEMILIGNGRIVARGTRTSCSATRPVEGDDARHRHWTTRQLTQRPDREGLGVHPAGDGLRVTAEPVDVGRVAAEQQIVLTDLRAGNGGSRGPVPRAHRRHPARQVSANEVPRHEHRHRPRRTLDVSRTPRVPFGRLVKVELRKLADTRAGRWLLISIAAVTLLVLIIQLAVVLGQDLHPKFLDFLQGMNTPMGILLPVLGVLLGDQRVEPAHGDGHVHLGAVAACA